MTFRKKIALVLFIMLAIQSCVTPGFNIESIQVAQLPQGKNSLHSYKRGAVIFKGISCPKGRDVKLEEESAVKNFINTIKSVSCSNKTYSFRSVNDDNYYVKQLRDTTVFSTRSGSAYEYYVLPAGRYYYPFDVVGKNINNDDLKKAFYFDVEEGRAFYVGDFVYDLKDNKIIVLDNYEHAKQELSNKANVVIEKALAKGSKVKYN